MGTTSQKLEYLNGTKSSLKTAINNLGGNITSSTTFRNYANVLNDIYDNLPKASDTGTNVSLSPTLKGRLGIVLKGNTLQDGIPTPDTPVEIQSATGTQKVVVSGKNSYDINNFELSTWDTGGGNYSSKVDGTIKSTSDFTIYRSKCVEIPNLKSNTDYTLSGSLKSTNTTGGKIIIYGYNGSSISSIKANDGTLSVGSFSLSFNTSNYTNIGISFNGVGGSGTKETIFENIMISTTGGEYQPYQEPQEVDIELGNIELNKIGDYEDYIDGTPDNWVLYKNIGKVVLDGSESWEQSASGIYRIASVYPNNVALRTEPPFAYSNYYTYGYYPSNITSSIQNNKISWNGSKFLVIRNDNATSVTNFKSWLSTHNTEILYVLATGTTETITDTNLVSQLNELYYLQSYNDTTNIDVTGNLPMRITASAIKGE